MAQQPPSNHAKTKLMVLDRDVWWLPSGALWNPQPDGVSIQALPTWRPALADENSAQGDFHQRHVRNQGPLRGMGAAHRIGHQCSISPAWPDLGGPYSLHQALERYPTEVVPRRKSIKLDTGVVRAGRAPHSPASATGHPRHGPGPSSGRETKGGGRGPSSNA